jgi:hypothetical protein
MPKNYATTGYYVSDYTASLCNYCKTTRLREKIKFPVRVREYIENGFSPARDAFSRVVTWFINVFMWLLRSFCRSHIVVFVFRVVFINLFSFKKERKKR